MLVYLAAMSIYGWPGRNHDVSYTQYWLTIAITFVCIIALSYFLKKRDEYRDKNKIDKEK